MKKRLLSLFISLAMILSIIPVTVMAKAPEGMKIYVGNEEVTSGGYWTTDSDGNVTAYTSTGTPTDNYIHYNAGNNTLTLHNATIKESVSTDTSTLIAGTAIGVVNSSGAAELTIQLEGDNTIEDVSTGIYVLVHSSSTGDASLTITGSGSLDASGSYNPGIRVQSNTGNGTLTITGAKVTASSSNGGNGVQIRCGEGSDASLTVNDGSLTTTGSGSSGAGIHYQFGSNTGSGTPSLTISGNTIVRANGGISDSSSADIQIEDGNNSSGGIVFDDGNGTVYGNVTLQEDLKIGKGEILTIPEGASLTTNGKLTVDGGTLNGTPSGDVTYKVTSVSLNIDNMTINVNDKETISVTIEPANAKNQDVTWTSDKPSIATVEANGTTSSARSAPNVKTATIIAVSPGTAEIIATVDGHTATCTVTVTKKQNDPIVKPRPSRPVIKEDKDLPSNTTECQKEYGKDYVYSEKYGACIIKYLIIPDTSAK